MVVVLFVENNMKRNSISIHAKGVAVAVAVVVACDAVMKYYQDSVLWIGNFVLV